MFVNFVYFVYFVDGVFVFGVVFGFVKCVFFIWGVVVDGCVVCCVNFKFGKLIKFNFYCVVRVVFVGGFVFLGLFVLC